MVNVSVTVHRNHNVYVTIILTGYKEVLFKSILFRSFQLFLKIKL